MNSGRAWVRPGFLRQVSSGQLNLNRTAKVQNVQLVHLGIPAQTLPDLTRSQVPIIRIDVLIRQGYTSLDTDVFTGLYYEFVGIDQLPFNGLLKVLGADPVGTNISRIAVTRSEVTGKPRVIDFFFGTNVRPAEGTGLISVSQDVTDNRRGVHWQADLNRFLKLATAYEVIFERPNGTHGYAIYNGQTQLDSVPDNVAANHEIPKPHTKRLASGIGCIYCHSKPSRTLGYARMSNDYADLLKRSPEFRNFAYQEQVFPRNGAEVQNNLLANNYQRLEELLAQFQGTDAAPIHRGQLDYSRAIQRATGIDVQAAAHATIAVWNHYEFDLVGAATALRDLGFTSTNEAEAVVALGRVLGTPVGFEDPILAGLKVGKPVDRGTWETKFGLAATRAANSLLLK